MDDTPSIDQSIIESSAALPGIEAQLGQSLAARDAATAQRDQDLANYNPEGATGPEPEFTAPTPQDHFQDVMKVSPLLMALGAVGGIFGKQHGIAMLASTNAMMKGVVQGNADAYQAAREQYNEQYQQYRDKSKTWLDVYKAYSTAYKGRIDADQKAVQGANAAVGVFENQARMTKGQVAQFIALKKTLEVKDAQIQRMSDQEITDMIKAEATKQNAASGAVRASASQQNAATNAGKARAATASSAAATDEGVQMIAELEDLIKHNKGMTGLAGKVQRGKEFVTSSVSDDASMPATQFQSKMELLIAKVPEILKMKGRMGKDQRDKIDAAVNGLKGGVSGPQAVVKLEALKRLLTDIPDAAQGNSETRVIDGTTYVNKNGTWYAQ